MPLDPTKESTKIVISSEKELMAVAQSQRKFYRNVEDIPPGKCFALMAIELSQPLTTPQYYSLFAEAQAKYGAEGIEVLYEGITPDYGDDYQIDVHTTVNLAPRKRPVEIPEPIPEHEPVPEHDVEEIPVEEENLNEE